MATFLDLNHTLEQLHKNPRGEAYISEANGDERYAVWLWLVDGELAAAGQPTHLELADFGWRAMYAAGCSPRVGAADALTWQRTLADLDQRLRTNTTNRTDPGNRGDRK